MSATPTCCIRSRRSVSTCGRSRTVTAAPRLSGACTYRRRSANRLIGPKPEETATVVGVLATVPAGLGARGERRPRRRAGSAARQRRGGPSRGKRRRGTRSTRSSGSTGRTPHRPRGPAADGAPQAGCSQLRSRYRATRRVAAPPGAHDPTLPFCRGSSYTGDSLAFPRPRTPTERRWCCNVAGPGRAQAEPPGET